MRQFPEMTSIISDRVLNLLKNNLCKSQAQVHQIQAQLVLQNLHFDTTIFHHFINVCQSLNLLQAALTLFMELNKPHVFICNSLMKAFAHRKAPKLPFRIYNHMMELRVAPNNFTFPFLLKSFADFKEVREGGTVHAHVVKLGHADDIYVSNSLLNLYASCREMGLCRKIFDEMPERDVVSWTVLINGNRNVGRNYDALIAFERMQFTGVEPNVVTMVNALSACAILGALEMGVWIHGIIRRRGWGLDVVLGTSLIDMYAKCGRVEEGIQVFESMGDRNVFTWNSIIKGLALAKNGEEAVLWFSRMWQEGYRADEVTLLNVLCTCNHSGLVQTGKEIFESLIDGKYGISPGINHYASMIDLLGRAGFLQDAFKVIEQMPFEPSKAMWGSLLAGCRAHGDFALSEYTAWKLLELEPGNAAYYTVLSNLYAEMGRWNDVSAVRFFMKDRGLCKDLGSSSVEIGDYKDYETVNIEKLIAQRLLD